MAEQSILIKLSEETPLPCSIYNPLTNTACGKPATVAWAYRKENQLPPLLGWWEVQPVCKDCAMAAAKVYG